MVPRLFLELGSLLILMASLFSAMPTSQHPDADLVNASGDGVSGGSSQASAFSTSQPPSTMQGGSKNSIDCVGYRATSPDPYCCPAGETDLARCLRSNDCDTTSHDAWCCPEQAPSSSSGCQFIGGLPPKSS